MKTILVPLDGSTLAEQVLPSVRQIAPVLSAQVQLIRVVTNAEIELTLAERGVAKKGSHSAADQMQEITRIVEERAAAYLAAEADMLRKAGLMVDYEVSVGEPAEAVLAAAAQHAVALIALATHGYSSLRRWALGSISDRIVHGAAMPVLAVRASESHPAIAQSISRIVVPLDGSKIAEQALPHALMLAQQTGAQIVLVSAVDPCTPLGWVAEPFIDPLQQRHDATLLVMESIADSLRRQSVNVRTIVDLGLPAEVIVSEAAEQGADIIVMATHDRSGFRRWIANSVADKVIQTTTTPLLLVRAAPSIVTHSPFALARSKSTAARRKRSKGTARRGVVVTVDDDGKH